MKTNGRTCVSGQYPQFLARERGGHVWLACPQKDNRSGETLEHRQESTDHWPLYQQGFEKYKEDGLRASQDDFQANEEGPDKGEPALTLTRQNACLHEEIRKWINQVQEPDI